jgi:GTP 3',8-cyclase
MTMHGSHPEILIDRFGRTVNYLRISITDRCDFRCVYCMSEEMTFLPRAQILTLEEIYTLAQAFVELGVKKIRITGGEPLVRRGAIDLLRSLGGLQGLNELVLTTNGSRLEAEALNLKTAGVKRINISLDTLKAEKFTEMTRVGDLAKVLRGIEAARLAGFARIKINSVVLKNRNHDEVCDLVRFAIDRDLDISFIEEMPLGLIDDHNRAEAYYPSDRIKADLAEVYDLVPTTDSTGGPSRYHRIGGTTTRVGFISPHSHNFCASCNRVRLTAEGRLLLCLGNEHAVDLKRVLRSHPGDTETVKKSIVAAMAIKPEKHEFDLQAKPVIFRHMSATGG